MDVRVHKETRAPSHREATPEHFRAPACVRRSPHSAATPAAAEPGRGARSAHADKGTTRRGGGAAVKVRAPPRPGRTGRRAETESASVEGVRVIGIRGSLTHYYFPEIQESTIAEALTHYYFRQPPDQHNSNGHHHPPPTTTRQILEDSYLELWMGISCLRSHGVPVNTNCWVLYFHAFRRAKCTGEFTGFPMPKPLVKLAFSCEERFPCL